MRDVRTKKEGHTKPLIVGRSGAEEEQRFHHETR